MSENEPFELTPFDIDLLLNGRGTDRILVDEHGRPLTTANQIPPPCGGDPDQPGRVSETRLQATLRVVGFLTVLVLLLAILFVVVVGLIAYYQVIM